MPATLTQVPGTTSNLDFLVHLATTGVLKPGAVLLVAYDPPDGIALDAAGVMSHKLPGMIRIIGGDVVPPGPSPYSHSMIVEDVERDAKGVRKVTILESTYINKSERKGNASKYDGIIRSDLLVRKANGKLDEGLRDRAIHRRYTRENRFPNIAVLDWGLPAHDAASVAARGAALFAAANKYATIELIGTLFLWWQGKTPGSGQSLMDKNPMDTPADYFCNAFVSECLQAASPPRATKATLRVDPSNVMPAHLYDDCARNGVAIHSIVRQHTVSNGATATLADLEAYLRP